MPEAGRCISVRRPAALRLEVEHVEDSVGCAIEVGEEFVASQVETRTGEVRRHDGVIHKGRPK